MIWKSKSSEQWSDFESFSKSFLKYFFYIVEGFLLGNYLRNKNIVLVSLRTSQQPASFGTTLVRSLFY